jgi:drug/metabolite transporter (DMT)-like permease
VRSPAAAPAAPPAAEPLPLRGFFSLALLSAIWGVNWPIIKIALEEVPVLTFRTLFLLCGGITLLIYAKAAGQSVRLPRARLVPVLLVALFNITLWHIFSGYAVTLIPSGHAAIIGYTMPVWGVLLGAVVLHEPLTWRRLTSLGLGMAGLAVLFLDSLDALEGSPLGILLMLCAALAWAIGTVGIKKVDWQMPTAVVVAWQCLLGAVPITIGAIVFEHDRVVWPSTWPLLAMLYNIAFSAALGHYLYYSVLRLFPVGIATIGTLAIPVIGLIAGALMLGEPLGAAEFGALALVAGALAVPVITTRQALRRLSGTGAR